MPNTLKNCAKERLDQVQQRGAGHLAVKWGPWFRYRGYPEQLEPYWEIIADGSWQNSTN